MVARELVTKGDEEYAAIAHLRGYAHQATACYLCKVACTRMHVCGHAGPIRSCCLPMGHSCDHAALNWEGLRMETWPRKV